MRVRQLHQQTESGKSTDSADQMPAPTAMERAEHDSWMLSYDVTEHDLPYLQPLLQAAFTDWHQEIPPQASILQGELALYDYNGAWIRGDHGLVSSTSACEVAKRCLAGELSSNGEIHTDGVYMAALIQSRQNQFNIAVLVCRMSKQAKTAITSTTISSNKEQMAEQVEQARLVDSVVLEAWIHSLRTHFYRRFEYLFVRDMVHSQKIAEREAKRRDVLYHVVRHIHDRIDVDSVLVQIVSGVERLVTDAHIEVYLSQDHRSENPKVKTLLFKPWSDPLVLQAFMKGEMCYRASLENGKGAEVAYALSGKQGSYGVLKVVFPNTEPDASDVQLIQLIVETAGTAFENARLHEQANEVIQELRFINELTKRINQSLRLYDVFHDATHELLHVFRADFCMLLQVSEDKKQFEVVSCNMSEYDGAKLAVDDGLFGYMYSLREPIIMSDTGEHTQLQIKFFEQLQLRSLIAAPLFIGGEMVGIVLLADRRPHFFTYDGFKLLQMLATHIGLAIANATLHARVKHMANKDQLTGLYARHYLDKQISRQQNIDFCGSLIIVDIDHFKQINDTYGHQTGDKILHQVSEIIRSSIRETDIAARWGGEELAIYFPQLNAEQTVRVAERIRARVSQETDPKVTVSCGIAEWTWQDEKISVESLFYRADMALYEAKNGGRNQIRVSS
ncbi:sensor domain-containing diguanylate cyclase [Paenibacillus sp. 481]|uniref:sensor domain-containing diguanylate cyclase n=1 Tax=Paenibacillus sp. 481 TaxID=2835869 RepID=UPI001E56DF6A|nr:sensor domain-containing diguanylate cyclase [Paenibacillus sp. 481]UHA74059.1 sensor domain-containing diguanylate cyclase [Paenibacillus sp. 481]